MTASSKAVVAQNPKQDVTPASQYDYDDNLIEAREHNAKASASAGLNLNVFGALSGLFASKSSKTTDADGGYVEEREDMAKVKGSGGGNLSAVASGAAEGSGRHVRRAIEN